MLLSCMFIYNAYTIMLFINDLTKIMKHIYYSLVVIKYVYT